MRNFTQKAFIETREEIYTLESYERKFYFDNLVNVSAENSETLSWINDSLNNLVELLPSLYAAGKADTVNFYETKLRQAQTIFSLLHEESQPKPLCIALSAVLDLVRVGYAILEEVGEDETTRT